MLGILHDPQHLLGEQAQLSTEPWLIDCASNLSAATMDFPCAFRWMECFALAALSRAAECCQCTEHTAHPGHPQLSTGMLFLNLTFC